MTLPCRSSSHTAFAVLIALTASIGCGSDASSDNDDGSNREVQACRGGSNVHVGLDGLCYCDNGYEWCNYSDPSNYNCCPTGGGGPTGGRDGGGTRSSACESSGSHSACASDEFCHRRECTDIFGRSWRISIISALAATTKPDGSAWDFGGGAPDLLACFDTTFDTSNYAGCTPVVQDSFSATWTWSTTFTMQSGGLVLVDVFDDDLSAEDFVMGVLEEGNDDLVRLARGAGNPITWSDGLGNQLTVRFDPDF